MRVHYSIFVLCCCLSIACCSVDPVFPLEDTIKQELMSLQGVTFAVNVEVKHPFLMVHNIRREDSLFHIYDLFTCELKSAFGIMGRGPDEFVLPWLLKSQLNDFLIYDNMRIYQFGVDEEGEPIRKGLKEPNYIADNARAAFINDTLFVVDAEYYAPSLHLLSINDELPRKLLPYRDPEIVDFLVDPNSGTVYANESRIVLCYRYKRQIDFMDIDFNLIKRVIFKDDHPVGRIIDAEQKEYYSIGYLGKRYLYALFIGQSPKEYLSLHTGGDVFLEVFDLNGNPVIRYRVDGINPGHFVVDEETFTLYGTAPDRAPEDQLLLYKLKGLS